MIKQQFQWQPYIGHDPLPSTTVIHKPPQLPETTTLTTTLNIFLQPYHPPQVCTTTTPLNRVPQLHLRPAVKHLYLSQIKVDLVPHHILKSTTCVEAKLKTNNKICTTAITSSPLRTICPLNHLSTSVPPSLSLPISLSLSLPSSHSLWWSPHIFLSRSVNCVAMAGKYSKLAN